MLLAAVAVASVAVLAARAVAAMVSHRPASTLRSAMVPAMTARENVRAVPALVFGEPRDLPGVRHGRRHMVQVVSIGSTAVEVHTARAFQAMYRAAARSGIELAIESGFRTRAEQAELYRAWRRRQGNRAARPGRSNHESGRALDLVVVDPEVRAWLEANAARFGFKRTVRGEAWHWEYLKAPRARRHHRHRRRRRHHRHRRHHRRHRHR